MCVDLGGRRIIKKLVIVKFHFAYEIQWLWRYFQDWGQKSRSQLRRGNEGPYIHFQPQARSSTDFITY